MERFQQFIDTLSDKIFSNDSMIASSIAKTLILFAILLIIRFIIIRNIEKNSTLATEDRLRWMVGVRNAMLMLFIFGFLLIWGAQIRDLALSVVALALAFVMSFKELITNFMGGLSRTISQQYTVGSRISIGDYRGDVVDNNMLTTVIMEIGPGQNSHQYTGNTISIPNSMLLNTPVINESYMRDYVLHVFHIPMKLEDDWRRAEKLLLRAANEICEPYLNRAQRYIEKVSRKMSLEPPSTDPRVSLVLSNPGEIDLIVRIPVPTRRKGRTEQEIIRKYLDYFYQ